SSFSNYLVESTWTKERSVQYIWTVSRGKNNDSFISTKTIHLDEQLVQGLFTLVVSTTKPSTTLTTNSINLINKYNTRCIFLCVFKQIMHQASTDPNEHLNKVRNANRKERCACFASNCTC